MGYGLCSSQEGGELRRAPVYFDFQPVSVHPRPSGSWGRLLGQAGGAWWALGECPQDPTPSRACPAPNTVLLPRSLGVSPVSPGYNRLALDPGRSWEPGLGPALLSLLVGREGWHLGDSPMCLRLTRSSLSRHPRASRWMLSPLGNRQLVPWASLMGPQPQRVGLADSTASFHR